MWKKIILKEEAENHKRAASLQDAFETAFINSGAPSNAAMYEARENNGKTRILFFSPAAIRLIRLNLEDYGPMDCPLPKPEDVTLLVGHDGARDPSSADE